ncbi:GtrA family protein [Sphingorhabdus sp. M41]|uniref:GtrA family protein n=1 Tax=Sphingorhabdus sp. M41 TaxID=1806885 RepID=UPI0018D3EE0B|nr:GtrA family protein [Sphingorhabdus sp. M41]
MSAQAMRYLIVGGLVFAFDFGVFTGLLLLNPHWLFAANIAGKIGGALLGFFLHRHFTFSWQKRQRASTQFISYGAVLLLNLIISSGLVYLFVISMNIEALIGRLFSDIVTIVLAFLLSRNLVFRRGTQDDQ